MWRQIGLGRHRYYWLALLCLGLAMEIGALIYQYALDYPPCVLCIHVRLWVAAMILVASLGLIVNHRRYLNTLSHLLMLGVMAAILDRSWNLLGTERGFTVASCDFNLGLPTWFAPDKWLPSVFEVQASCGYTPELLWGVTMAEFLLVISVLLVITSMTSAIASLVYTPESL